MKDHSLIESEQVFRELFDNMSSGVAVYEPINDGDDFIFKDINKAGERISQIKRKDIIEKKVTEIFPSIQELGLFEVFQRVWKTGKPEKHPSNLYKDDRLAQWVENYVYKIPSGNIVAIYDDITEKRLAEEKLEESEAKFRKIFMDSPIGIELYDSEGHLIDANKACLEIFGISNIDAIKGFELFKDPNVSEEIKIRLINGESVRYVSSFDFEKVKELNLYETDKSGIIYSDVLITPLYIIDSNKVSNYLVQVQDITKSRMNEIELDIRNQISQIFLTVADDEMYPEVLNVVLHSLNSKFGVFAYIDEDGNSVCPSMTRDIWDQCQMEDKTIIFPRENWGGIWADSMIEKKTKYSNEPFSVPKGHIEIENALSVPIIYQDTCLGHFLVANKDDGYNENDIKMLESIAASIAPILHARLNRNRQEEQRKLAEKALKKSEENLILLNKELEQKVNDRTKKLKESEEKYKEAYNRANLYKDIFAHDINNILQNIKSSAELSSLYLNSPDKLSAIKEFNVIINEQVTRGGKLINNVQKLSHIDESKITLNPVEVCIALKDSIKFVKQSLPNRNINISVDSFSDEILVLADNLLLDVFENILFNGARHNSNLNVKIGIKTSKKKDKGKKFIKFEFTDNGIGIEDTRKEYIFKRGFGDKSKKGMGLGLSLVKKIISNYNGEIWVENRVEGDYSKGSNFIILIPEAD